MPDQIYFLRFGNETKKGRLIAEKSTEGKIGDTENLRHEIHAQKI